MRIKLDIPLTITEAAMAMQASFYAPKALITHICTDSRECEMGDLFFALKGKSQSGEEYVYHTISKGAYAVSKKKLTGTLTVKSPEQALLSLAKYYKNMKETQVIDTNELSPDEVYNQFMKLIGEGK